jgi:sec-independent protein translocase protein TatC
MAAQIEDDLFAEEQTMPAMSFGEHIEDLRRHLVYALLGLAVGVIITFIPPMSLGARVLRQIQDPAQRTLNRFYGDRATERALAADAAKEMTAPADCKIALADLAEALRAILPDTTVAPKEALEGREITLPLRVPRSYMIQEIAGNIEKPNALVSFAPMEGFTIFFSVCLVTGLVISSPWVFWQLWLFVAAGLYKHERAYVRKFLPLGIGLFLAGVFLCFFAVLPWTLEFLLNFNVWLDIEPNLRISEWVGFATFLPLIFGVCFQTPLVMLILERLGVMSLDDFRAKRKYAILIMAVGAAVITPTGDPLTMIVLAAPMIMLYELGIVLMARRGGRIAPVSP